MKSHVRVAVIGGGVVGCSVLYHLTKGGWSDVALIERSEHEVLHIDGAFVEPYAVFHCANFYDFAQGSRHGLDVGENFLAKFGFEPLIALVAGLFEQHGGAGDHLKGALQVM